MPIQAGFKSFTASRIQNAAGALLASGTLGVVPTDINNNPISAIAGGEGGAITDNEAQTPVVNGAISGFVVADTEETTPPIFYRVIIRDGNGVPIFCLPGIETTGASFNLDTYGGGSGGGEVMSGGPSAGVTFIDSADASHWNLAVSGGEISFNPAASDIGTPVAGVTFIDSADASHWNLTVSGGVQNFVPAVSDIGTAVSSISIIDSATGETFVISVTGGELSPA